MRSTPRILLLAGLLALAEARAADAPATMPGETAAPAPAAGEPAVKSYDALFSEILQNLPEASRAKVDSARSRGPESRPSGTTSPGAAVPGAVGAEQRAKALERLSPEVKERVEKAIRNLENRNLDRMLEFKEPEK